MVQMVAPGEGILVSSIHHRPTDAVTKRLTRPVDHLKNMDLISRFKFQISRQFHTLAMCLWCELLSTPHICHRHHRRCTCKKNLLGAIFSRFNGENCIMHIYFTLLFVIFGCNLGLTNLACVKDMTNMRYASRVSHQAKTIATFPLYARLAMCVH